MDAALKAFYAPIQPFVLHPERAWLVAALFAILFAASLARSGTFKPLRHLVILLAVMSWVLFGLIEVMAQARGWDIRVDILVSWPVVLAASIAAVWAAFRNGARRAHVDQRAEKSSRENAPHSGDHR